MQLLAIGLNHTTTPLHLREKLALSNDHIRAALARLSHAHDDEASPITEMAILSTCNRVEIYAVSQSQSFAELETFLSDERGVAMEAIQAHLYRLANEEVVRHLLNVAAGLDSMVIGEPQILGQVTRALELARGVGAAGPILSRLFQTAISAGKRARTETAISRNPTSVSSLAASLSERSVGDISSAKIIILGAGEMAELAVESLRKRGAEKITVVNRTLDRAHALASRWHAKADTFEHIDRALVEADILISSTGAPHTIINREMVATAMQRRSNRPLVLIDIAVPRDIEADAGEIDLVDLFDIDNLNAHLEQSLADRLAAVPHVQSILAAEESRFMAFYQALDVLPIITDMRRQAEALRRNELEKTLRKLPELTDSERTSIESMTQALVKKLLDHPTKRLRAEASCPHAPEYATVARTLFALEGGSGMCGFSGKDCPISEQAISYSFSNESVEQCT
jgi:glutamyl-tRNA reductase